MAQVLTPNSGTLGEFGLTETCGYPHKKKRRKTKEAIRKPPRDEDEYEHEMDMAAEDAMQAAMEDEEADDEDEPMPRMRRRMRRHMKGRRAQEVYKNGKKVEIHTAKWHRCVEKVRKRGGGYNEYAVCTASLGREGSIKAGHRRK